MMVGLRYVAAFLLLQTMCISAMISLPVHWLEASTQGDLLYNCSGTAAPAPFGPALGNGFWATVVGLNSSHVAGVYNGRSFETPSHRAALPSPFHGVSLANSTLLCQALDMRRAMFLQLLRMDATGALVETAFWMQRNVGGVAVFQYQLVGGDHHGEALLHFEDNRLPVDQFTDFTWQSESGVHVGTTTTSETPSSGLSTVAMIGASFPDQGRLTHGVPLLFISVVANTTAAALRLNSSISRHSLYAQHVSAWSTLWQSGISFPSNLYLGASVNASMYAILSQIRADLPYMSTSPGGLGTNAYNGHVFWDFETWMFPALLLLHPGIAENGLHYRLNRLAQAQEKSASFGFKGALFPWESAFTGVDCVPDPTKNPEARYEQHVSGDVSLAFQQHFRATKNLAFLHKSYPLISGVAKLWSDRLVNGHIYQVMTPDESARVVDDSAYTNAVASLSLRWAVEASMLLGVSFPQEWISKQNVFIPVNGDITLEHANYTGEMINQDDVGLLYWPLKFYPIDFKRVKADLQYYSKKTRRNGYFTGNSAYSVAMLRAGLTEQALQWWDTSFLHIRGPWRVFNERISGGHPHFITGAGGFLQNVIYGFAGISVEASQLRVAPALACDGCLGLTLRNIHYLQFVITIELLDMERSKVENNGQEKFCINEDMVVIPHSAASVSNPFTVSNCKE